MHTDDKGDEYEPVARVSFKPMVDERTLEIEERYYPADDGSNSLYEVTISTSEPNHRTEVYLKSTSDWLTPEQLRKELDDFAAFRNAVIRAYDRLKAHADREVFPRLKELGY